MKTTTDKKNKVIDLRQKNEIKCPLCNETIKHQSKKEKDCDEIHFWSCEHCPFVGFEFVNNEDIGVLSNYLLNDNLMNELDQKIHNEILNKIQKFEERENPQAQAVKIFNLKVEREKAMYDVKVYNDYDDIIEQFNNVEISICTQCGEIYQPASHADIRCQNCGNHQEI